MKKFLMSSADPAKVGLAVRGFLTMVIPILIIFTGLPEKEINTAVDTIVAITIAGTTIFGGIQFLLGLARKARLGRWTAAE